MGLVKFNKIGECFYDFNTAVKYNMVTNKTQAWKTAAVRNDWKTWACFRCFRLVGDLIEVCKIRKATDRVKWRDKMSLTERVENTRTEIKLSDREVRAECWKFETQ